MCITDLLPKVIVFDLDDTIWHGDIVDYEGPPYSTTHSPHQIIDRAGSTLSLCQGALQVMEFIYDVQVALKKKDYDMAWDIFLQHIPEYRTLKGVHRSSWNTGKSASGKDCDNNSAYFEVAWASRPDHSLNSQPALDAFRVKDDKTFWDISTYSEIYPGNKDVHLSRIREAAGCQFDRMILYDNEIRNIKTSMNLGVQSIHTREGITWDQFSDSILKYAKLRVQLFSCE